MNIKYECSKIVNIDTQRRKIILKIYLRLEEKYINNFGPIQYDYEWIKVDTITNVIDKYSKNTRDLES